MRWGEHGYMLHAFREHEVLSATLLALLIAGAVFLVRSLGRCRGSYEEEEAALDILKERYVRGEIDRQEYEEKKQDIRQR